MRLGLGLLLLAILLVAYWVGLKPRQDRARWARDLEACTIVGEYQMLGIRACLMVDRDWPRESATMAGALVAYSFEVERKVPDYYGIAERSRTSGTD